MFRGIFKKLNKNRADEKDKEIVDRLVGEGNSYLSQLQAIDRQILSVQKSTKTTFSFFSPIHNYCRSQYQWYYNWHVKPYATKIHAGVLTLVLLSSLVIGSFSIIGKPHSVMAATTDCTWTNGGGNNIWNNAANWSCGNVPNNTNNVIFNGATSNANITIDVAATVGSFTTTGGGSGVGGQATVGNTGGVLHFASNGANVSIDASTGNFSGYAWLDDAGWVAFGTTDNADGPVNENLTTGAVTGKAKILNDGTLIDFNASPYNSNVAVTLATGAFLGYAWSDSLGWLDFSAVTASKAYTGTITANFNVTTDVSQGGSGDFTLGGGTYIANATNISVAGNYARTGGTFTAGTGTITMIATTTGKTFTAGGQTYNNITFNGVGGGWSLIDNLTTSSTGIINLTNGTLHTDGPSDNSGLTHSWAYFDSTNSNIRTLTLGASSITITASNYNGTAWGVNTSTNLTLNAGTSTITFTGASARAGFGLAMNNVVFQGGGTTILYPVTSINNFTFTGTASQTNAIQLATSTPIINNALTIIGNSAINRVLIYSSIVGTARSITLGASATMASTSNYVDFQDITVTGGATNERDFQTNAKSAGDCGGNTGITFTTAAPQTWTGATGNWSTAGLWTSRIPLPQDNVTIPDPGAASRTLTADMPRLGHDITVTNTNATNKPTLALTNQDNTIYGSLTLVSSTFMTFTRNKTLSFAGRATAYLTTSALSMSGAAVNIYKPTASLIFNDAYSSANSITLYNGNLTTSTSVTVYAFTAMSGTTVTMGDATWTIISEGGWTAVGATITANNSTIAYTYTGANASTFLGGVNTYNNIQIAPGSGILTFSGAFTFANMTMASAGTKTVKFAKSTTYTMTGNNFLSGSGTGNITINSDDGATAFTLNKTGTGIISSDYLTLDRSTATQTNTFYAGAHSTDGTHNTNWIFTAPPVPIAPTVPTQTVDSTTQITFGWTDNSNNETGFKVYVSTVPNADCSLATYPGTPNYTTAANATSQAAPGLSVNSQYCGKITAYNDGGESSAIYSAPKYTLSNTPTAPTVNQIPGQPTQLQVILGVNANPATTQFAFGVDNNSDGAIDASSWTQANGSLGASAVWQTYAQWGSGTGATITGLTAATSYNFIVQGRNGDNTTTAFGPGASQTTVAITNTISGSLYSDLGVTKIGAAKTIYVSVNGGAADSSTTSGGDFSVYTASNLNANDIITVFVSGDAGTKASTITKVSATGNLTGINLYQNYTIIRHEGSIASIINTDLATADNVADSDALISVNGSNVASFSQGLYIWTGKTYAPGNSVNVAGNWNSSAGTFTYGTSTVTMTATNGNVTLTTPSSGNSYDGKFYNLTINSGANKVSFLTGTSAAPSHALNITGEYEIGTGLLARTGDTASLTINASGKLSGAGGYIQSISNTAAAVVNNGTISIATFNYYLNAGSTTAPITATTYGGALAIVNAGFASTTGVLGAGTLSVLGSSLSISGSNAYSLTLDNTVNNAAISVTGNLLIGASGNTTRYGILKPGTGTVTVNGNLIVYPSDTNGDNKIDSTGVNTPWTITGNMTLSDIWIAGSSTISVAGNWDSSAGTFTYGTSTVTMTGTTKTINTPAAGTAWGTSFYNLTINSGASVSVITAAPSTGFRVYNALNISGTVTVNAGHSLRDGTTITGSLVINNGGVLTGTGEFQQIILSTTTPVVNNGTISITDFWYNIESSTGAPITATTYGGNLYFYNGIGAQNVGGVIGAGTLSVGGTIQILGLTGYTTTIDNTTNNSPVTVATLKIGHSATNDYAVFKPGTGAVTVTGDITIYVSDGAGGNHNKLDCTGVACNISVGGNWTNSDTFNAGTSTVNFTKASGTQTLNSGGTAAANTFNNVTHSGAGTLQLLTNDLKTNGNFLNSGGIFTTTDGTSRNVTVGGDFTISNSSTVTANASTISVGGNWDSSAGTFTYGTSTVTFTAVAGNTTIATKTNVITFANLTINSGANKVTFTGADQLGFYGNVNITGNLEIASGKYMYGYSAWNFVINASSQLSGAGSMILLTSNGWNKGITNSGTISLANFFWVVQAGSTTAPITATTYGGNMNVMLGQAVDATAIIGAGTLNVTGTLTIDSSRFFGVTGHTVTVDNTTNNTAITAGALTIGVGITNRYNLFKPGTGAVTVNGDLTVYASDVSGDNKIDCTGVACNILVAGNWLNSDTFVAGNSTVNFTKTSGTQTLTSGGVAAANIFNNLTHSGAGVLQLATNAINIDGNFLNDTGAGNFDANGQNISIAKNWTINAGAFSAGGTPGAQTVTFDGTAGQTLAGNTTFHNLTINTADSAAGRTVSFAAASVQTIITPGVLTIGGESGKVLTLGRSGGTGSDVYSFAIPANMTSGQYINVANNTVTGGVITPGSWTNVTNGGNNSGWDFDTTAPIIDYVASPVSPNGSNGWYRTTPTVTLTATSNQSAVTSLSYRWGSSGDFTTVAASSVADIPVPVGTNTLYSYAVDEAGNTGIGTPSNQEYKVDTLALTVDIAASPADANGTNGYYKTTAPSITLTADDGTGSGVGSISYKWDSGEYTDYSIQITAPEGTHTIYYYGTDLAGNTTSGSPVSREYKVDTVLPTASVAISPVGPNGDNGYYIGTAPVVTLSGADGTSGLSDIEYQWSTEGSYSTYTIPLTVPEGTIDLSYYSTDNAGNSGSGSPSIVTYKVDLIAPTLTSIPTATSPTNNLTANFIWDAAIDSNSGVDSYYVTIGSSAGQNDIRDNEQTTNTNWSETFTETGTYYIRIKAKDAAGNLSGFSGEGSVVGSSIVIDREAPLVTISNLVEGQFVTTNTITLTGTASDQLTGLNSIQLQIDNGAFVDATLTGSTWSYEWANYTEGNHIIKAKALDKAGNEAYSATFAIVVDTTSPSIPSDFRGFNVSNVPASVFATYMDFAGSTDATSGLKSYEIYKNGSKLYNVPIAKDSSNQYYTGNVKQPYYLIDSKLSSAKYSYKIRAIDNAGNSSETANLVIDTAGKTIETDSISEAKGNPSSVVTKKKTSGVITWKTVYPATSYVEYGESASYGNKTDIDNSMNQGHSVLLPDLKPDATYHAKVKSHDLYGKDLSSADFTFTTKQAPEDMSIFKIIIDALQNLFKTITAGAADQPVSGANLEALQGFSNNLLLTDISFKEKGYFGNILTFEKNKKIERSTDDKNYATLTPSSDNYYFDKTVVENTMYYYRLDGGNPIVRKPVLGDDSPLTIKNAGVVKESIQTSKDKAQLTVSWSTNRGSTSQVEFGTSGAYGQKTKEDPSLNMGHNIILEDLSPDTTYHFRSSSKDSQGKIAASDDFTFQTPSVQKDKSPIDIIFESFQRIFGAIRSVF